MIDSSLLISIRDSTDSNPGASSDSELARRNMAVAEEEAPSMWNFILRSGRCEGKDKASATQAEPVRPAGKS